jgi:hypothetical protein
VEPTPPPGGIALTLIPAAEAVGWASDLDGQSRFNVPNIHAGFFKGHIYYGALQFDLSGVPASATISEAVLELTGLDDQRLSPGGTWQLHLLAADTDTAWPSLSYDLLRKAIVEATVPPALTSSVLSRGRVNVFSFDPEQLLALQRHVANGLVSFRLDGPTSGEDNLFTWDSGYGENGYLATKPVLRIIAVLPTPTSTPTYVIITSTPIPENILTVAAIARTATAQARSAGDPGTPTPLPRNWVTPVIIANTPTPANAATATFVAAAATAWAFVFGTPTALPPNVWTATSMPTATPPPTDVSTITPMPTATPVPLLIPLDQLALTPTPTATPAPLPIPDILRGKIAFVSDRLGEPRLFAMDPDGKNVALLTQSYPYDQARARENVAPDGLRCAIVKPNGHGVPQIFLHDPRYHTTLEITRLTGAAYDPAWAPHSDWIAFVSTEPGNDEVYTVRVDGSGLRRLTSNSWEWDKHPSWSPDGTQIVFYSNRDVGRRQIWTMNADGSNQHNISNNESNDWDPVWIK